MSFGWFGRLVSPAAFLPREAVLAFVRDPLLACLLEAALRPAGFDLLLAATVEDGIVTLGFPSWLNISDPADQALFASMAKGIAQHFIAAGEPVPNYELVNEADGHYGVVDMANTFNAVAVALKSVDPAYKLGGLTESYARPDDLKTFFQIMHVPGFA